MKSKDLKMKSLKVIYQKVNWKKGEFLKVRRSDDGAWFTVPDINNSVFWTIMISGSKAYLNS